MKMVLFISLLCITFISSEYLKCNVLPKDREDCGFIGLNKQKCEEKGCCFESSAEGPWCFYPEKENTIPKKEEEGEEKEKPRREGEGPEEEKNDDLLITKIKEARLELNKEQKCEQAYFDILNYLVLELKNEIKRLKTKINNQKNQINELINKTNYQTNIINNQKIEIDELKNNLNSQKNEINEIKEQIKSWIDYKINLISINNSLILKNNLEYIKLIKDWINPNKIIKSELLYRLSRDGEAFSTFHQLCDNKGPTLTLFYTEEGNLGGIYTPLSWDGYSGWKNDLETFIFNLNKKQKYKKIKEELSIDCNYSYGPWVAHCGFDRSSMKKIRRTYIQINDFFEKGEGILESKEYNVLEVEVYKIIIE